MSKKRHFQKGCYIVKMAQNLEISVPMSKRHSTKTIHKKDPGEMKIDVFDNGHRSRNDKIINYASEQRSLFV